MVIPNTLITMQSTGKQKQKNLFSLSKARVNRAVNSQITVRSEEKVFQNKIYFTYIS